MDCHASTAARVPAFTLPACAAEEVHPSVDEKSLQREPPISQEGGQEIKGATSRHLDDGQTHFCGIPEYLQHVTTQARSPTQALLPSVHVVVPEPHCTGKQLKQGLPDGTLPQQPSAMATELGCVPVDPKAFLGTSADNALGFGKLAECALQGNLPGLQQSLSGSSPEKESLAGSEAKPLVERCDGNGRGLLSLAVHGGSSKCCEYLLTVGCDVDAPDAVGNTALHYACCIGDHGAAKLLRKAGAAARLQNRKGCTPWHLAVASGNEKTVQALTKDAKDVSSSGINLCSHSGVSPLSLAVHRDLSAAVGHLLKAKADQRQASAAMHGYCPVHFALHHSSKKTLKLLLDGSGSWNATTAVGLTPLSLAAIKGNITHAELLLKKGASVEHRDNLGCTAFHWAAFCGQTAFLSFLLEWKKGALQSVLALCDTHGASPLHFAALQGHTPTVRLLLAKGCPVDEADSAGRLPGHYAVLGHRSMDTLQEVFNAKPDIVRHVDKEGNTVLHLAALTGDVHLLTWLVSTYTLEVNVQTKDLCSGLWLASRHGHTDCAQWLAKHSADIHLANHQKLTPLHVACQYGHSETANCLLNCGAEVTSLDENAQMPLHLASAAGHAQAITLLLSKGSSVHATCKTGRAALSFAAEFGHTAACRVLVESGAEVNWTGSAEEHLSPLDYALGGGHRECADYIVSVCGVTRGGRFHRAVATLQAVWKFKTRCRQKKIARDHAARVLQKAAAELLQRRTVKRDSEHERRRRQWAAKVIQVAWRQYVSEKHRYEASYKKLKTMLAREKRQTYLSLETIQYKQPSEPAQSRASPMVTSLTRNRRMTLAPQRVPRLDSKEHDALVASMTNMVSGLEMGIPLAAGGGSGGSDNSKLRTKHPARPPPAAKHVSLSLAPPSQRTPTTQSPSLAKKVAASKSVHGGPEVTPKQLTLSVKQTMKTDGRKRVPTNQKLAPIEVKRKGHNSPRHRPAGYSRPLLDTVDVIQKLEDSIAHRDGEIQRLRKENERLLAREKDERLASNRLPAVVGTVFKPARGRIEVGDEAALAYRKRTEGLNAILRAVQTSGGGHELAIVNSRSPRLQTACTAVASSTDALDKALQEAAHLQSHSERLNRKVLSRSRQHS